MKMNREQRVSERNMRKKSLIAAVAAMGLAVFGGTLVASSTAVADVPTTPIAVPFEAAECIGTTWEDPSQADGPVSNLLLVFGERLNAYNAGEIVPLYDVYGGNEVVVSGGGYPAVCSVRYDSAAGGPISEWMFCTDYFSRVCAGTNVAGELVDKDGNVLDWPAEVGNNPKLDADAEKIVVALINGTWEYSGVDGIDLDTDIATVDLGSSERAALQMLVWCVTDPVDPATTNASELKRAATCASSMPQSLQDEILASVPDTPELSIVAADPASHLAVGAQAEFVVTTNLLNTGIDLSLTGAASGLSVVSGPAVLHGTTLTVTGAGPVRIAVTGDSAGTIELVGSVLTVSTDHLAWHQATPVNSAITTECQVFATMFGMPETLASGDVASFTATIAPVKPIAVHTAVR